MRLLGSLAIISFLLFLAYVAPSRRLQGGWSSPAVVYHGTWAFLFILDSLPVIHYNSLSEETLWQVVASHATFALASATVCIAAVNQNREHGRAAASLPPLTNQQEARLRRALLTMTLVGAAGSLLFMRYVSSRFGGVRGFILDSQVARIMVMRGEIGAPLLLSLLRTFNYACTPLCAYYLMATQRWRAVWVYFPLVSVWIESVASLGRTLFLWNTLLFISSLLILYAARRGGARHLLQLLRQRIRLILVVVALAGLLWYGANLIRQIRGRFDDFQSTVSGIAPYTDLPVGNSYLLNSLVTNYTLATGGLHAFNEVVEQFDNRFYWGAATFESFIDLGSRIVGTDLVSQRLDRYRFVNIPFSFNVHTFLREPFEDGGLVGVILFSYLLGMISTLVYIRWHRTKSLPSYAVLAFVLLLLEYSVIVNLFSASSIFWMAATVSTSVLALIRPGKETLPPSDIITLPPTSG
jgi:oligosaccharide repeat unit polymerase